MNSAAFVYEKSGKYLNRKQQAADEDSIVAETKDNVSTIEQENANPLTKSKSTSFSIFRSAQHGGFTLRSIFVGLLYCVLFPVVSLSLREERLATRKNTKSIKDSKDKIVDLTRVDQAKRITSPNASDVQPHITSVNKYNRSLHLELYHEKEATADDQLKLDKLLTQPLLVLNDSTLKPSQIPRPLLPKTVKRNRKFLVLDLDETLIHSMKRGTRMSSGHMVEVKIMNSYAILYYVYKRPYCDEFLRTVSKWYNLVVFTASAQEYADPILDWLEQGRRIFSERFYRHHCVLVDDAYVKDLSAVSQDLSQVILIDNSPLSYAMHEDNAIPIGGWVSDPSDRQLLCLMSFLQALRHVSDVRAVLGLRLGVHDVS